MVAESVAEFARKTPILRPDLLTSIDDRRRMETQLTEDLRRYDLTIADVKQRIEAALPQQAAEQDRLTCSESNVRFPFGVSGPISN